MSVRQVHALADLASLISPAKPQRTDRERRVWSCSTPGVLPAPLPRRGGVTRPLPGGEPPVAYRTANDWTRGNSYAREPFASRSIRAEILADRRHMQGH